MADRDLAREFVRLKHEGKLKEGSVADTSVEERARRACGCDICGSRGPWRAQRNLCASGIRIAAELRTYGEQRAGEEREANCKTVCDLCRDDVQFDGDFHVYMNFGERAMGPCNAAAIRRRT